MESHLNKKLAFQIRALRGDLSQAEMAKKLGIKQQVLSRLENPSYGKPSTTTLKNVAAACDVALVVEFVPFSQLIDRVSGTPYVERGVSPETFSVPSFEEEEKRGTLTGETIQLFPFPQQIQTRIFIDQSFVNGIENDNRLILNPPSDALVKREPQRNTLEYPFIPSDDRGLGHSKQIMVPTP